MSKKKIVYPSNIEKTVASHYPIAKITDSGNYAIGYTRPAGKWFAFVFLSGAYPNLKSRWQFGVESTEETGSDAGSNFGLLRCGDAGTDEDFSWVMIAYRDSGNVMFLNGVSADAYYEFSPKIEEDTGIRNPTPDDYLDWALMDAEKPSKPYEGNFIDADRKKANKKINEEANKHGIFSTQDEQDKYGKEIGKMSIGTARWAKEAREKIKFLESEVKRLETMILELKENK